MELVLIIKKAQKMYFQKVDKELLGSLRIHLFQQLSLGEGLNAVGSSDAADSREQQPPQVHKRHTVEGDLQVPLSQLFSHIHTFIFIHTIQLRENSEPFLILQSCLTILVSAAFVSLIISTGHSLLSVIFCRSLNVDAQIV